MHNQADAKSAKRLFVEIPQHRRADHAEIMIRISKEVAKKTLTKEQAIALREKYCKVDAR